MIQSYLEIPVALASNESPVAFIRDCIRTRSATCCGWLQHNEGSPVYKIIEGGLYEITFNANVSSATAGTIALALLNDGAVVPGTTVAETIATAGDYANVAFNKKIKVCCRGNANLTIASVPAVPTPTDIATPITTVVPIIANANFTITRLSGN